jgi:hypothetical protein
MRKLYCFLHIPKTGGTSFIDVIEQNFKKNHEVFRFPRGVEPKHGWEPVEFIHGHFPYGFHKIKECFPGRKIVYFTFLRNPIERLWSHYNFWKISQNIDKNTVSDWIECFKKDSYYMISNTYCYYLGDDDPEIASYRLGTEIHYGNTESFDLSLKLFKVFFPDVFKIIKYEKKNITKGKPPIIPKDFTDRMIDLNHDDIRLYNGTGY